jgi:hypothetical protein
VQRVQYFVPGAVAFGDAARDGGGKPPRQARELPDVVQDQCEQRDGEDRPARRLADGERRDQPGKGGGGDNRQRSGVEPAQGRRNP